MVRLAFSDSCATVAAMGLLYEKVVRPFFFGLDAEHAHERGVNSMALLGRMGPVCRLMEAWSQLPSSRFAPVKAAKRLWNSVTKGPWTTQPVSRG